MLPECDRPFGAKKSDRLFCSLGTISGIILTSFFKQICLKSEIIMRIYPNKNSTIFLIFYQFKGNKKAGIIYATSRQD